MGLLESLIARLEALESKINGGEIVTPTEPVTTDTTVKLDKDNCPWDERINSSTKTTTALGVYTRRKGISDELYNSVRDEIRVTTTAPATQRGRTRPRWKSSGSVQSGCGWPPAAGCS